MERSGGIGLEPRKEEKKLSDGIKERERKISGLARLGCGYLKKDVVFRKELGEEYYDEILITQRLLNRKEKREKKEGRRIGVLRTRERD